jgi:DNA (cytosine-5)-methyltransferase 1
MAAPRRRKIPTISLFSGAGGLDLGFLAAGFDIRGCVEINPDYCATLRANIGHSAGFGSKTQVHSTDIRSFDPGQYADAGIECVIGGPPCQTFSAAGRRSGGVIGTADERGQLFQSYCHILDQLHPKVFVFENVYGLPGANGGGPWREITSAFASRGYTLRAEVVDAADYGVPQHRERLIIVGYRDGNYEFPEPTHGPDSKSGNPLVSVEDAIANLQDPKEPYHDNLGGMYGHLLPLVPEGLNYAFFTAEMGHPEPVFAWRSKFHDLLYKVDRGSPCRTIKAQPGKFTGPFHWKNRHFTAAELRRLQTFPDDYELVGSSAKVLEQIGNSVPPRLAHVIAVSVREQLLDKRRIGLEFPVRPAGFRSTFRQRQRERTKHFSKVASSAIASRPKGHQAKKAKAAASVAQGRDRSPAQYFLAPTSLFDRHHHAQRQVEAKDGYSVRVREKGSAIQMVFARLGKRQIQKSRLTITGLSKYLPNYDSLSVTAAIDKPIDVFHLWAAVEEALVARSEFFTLIDIYGHYANRGDTVKVKADWQWPASLFGRTLNWLTSSERCGDFVEVKEVLKELRCTKPQLEQVVAELRAVRFDFRTSETHPIIGADRVLCTYPFPLLSPRALVESRVKLIRSPRRHMRPTRQRSRA